MCRIFAVILATMAFAVPAFAQQECATLPDVKPGDKWTYNRFDGWNNRLVGVEVREIGMVDDTTIIERTSDAANPSRAANSTFTREWNTVVRLGFQVHTPYFPNLAFPLEVGKKWKMKSSMENRKSGSRYQYASEAEVEGAERKVVGGETFDTCRVKIVTQYHAVTKNGNGSGRMVTILWHAPSIKRPVVIVYEDTDWAGQPYDKWRWELKEREFR